MAIRPLNSCGTSCPGEGVRQAPKLVHFGEEYNLCPHQESKA